MKYYFGPWVWDTSDDAFMPGYWRGPRDVSRGLTTQSCLDFRSVPDMAPQAVGQRNVGLFALPDAARLPLDWRFMGTDLSAVLSSALRAVWQTQLGLRALPPADTIASLCWWSLTQNTDPTGDDKPLPLQPSVRRRQWEMLLSGATVRREAFSLSANEWAPSRDSLQREYGSLYANDQTLARKWLGYQVNKLRLKNREWEQLQPQEIRGEEPLPPRTTITESFDQSDSSTLGPDLSWTEIGGDHFQTVSNEWDHKIAAGTGNQRLARADTDLSGSDMYAETDVTTLTAGGSAGQAGAAVRMPSTATHTCYMTFISTASSNQSFFKIVSGSYTSLGSGAISKSLPDTLRVQADGSTISHDFNGSETNSTTDTAIAGNVRAGLYGRKGSGASNTTRGDNFEASDDLSAPASTPRLALLGAG